MRYVALYTHMSANVLYDGVSEVCIVLVCDNTDKMSLPHIQYPQ
jgi:hypothetical protein